MILEKGDMFSIWGKTDLFLFTANPCVNKQGLAVMGRGIAKQLAEKCPNIRKRFGDYLTDVGGLALPYCEPIMYDEDVGQHIGYFLVKGHWRNRASLGIIKESVDDLIELIRHYHGTIRVDLNFPGIGNGKLAREDVLPLIERLPDNVHIWTYD